MTPYAVVFIDLQGSSASPAKRARLQQQLLALRDQLNARNKPDLSVPFQVVWGDELKGVLYGAERLWELYRQVYSLMPDTPFYYAVGLGSIDTSFSQADTVDINLLDGTAFKAARQALDNLKAKPKQPYCIEFATAGSSRFGESLNAYVTICNDLVAHMTPAQYRHFIAEYPWHQQAHGEKEHVSRQAVWETLQRARIDAYKAACAGLESLLAVVTDHPALVLPGGDA